jgi:light-regulated signal transduction histidine kinase (bacteriophytochrome)
LEEANKELEAFGYSVSHDLRAPLRVIDGFSNMLLEDYGDKLNAEAIDHLRTIRTATQKMSGLIDDLLRLSRAARCPIRRSHFDLSEMVQAVAGELQRAEPERNMRFVIEPGCAANADRDLLRIVVENALGNAWKFTRRATGARIEFGTHGTGTSRAFFVRDNGAGFDAESSDKLFAPFQRLHTAEEFPGTGIGLATVQRIIHRHGGKVWIEGAVDRGATLCFTLGEPE